MSNLAQPHPEILSDRAFFNEIGDPFALWRDPKKTGMRTTREASDYHNEHHRKRIEKGYKRPKSAAYTAYKEYRKKFWKNHQDFEFIYATHIDKETGKPVFPNSSKPAPPRPCSPWLQPPSPRAPTATHASSLREKLWIREKQEVETNTSARLRPPRPTSRVTRPQSTSSHRVRVRRYGKSYNGVLNKKMKPFLASNSRSRREEIVPGILTGVSVAIKTKEKNARTRHGINRKVQRVGVKPGTPLWKEPPPSPILVRHNKSSLLMKQRWSPRNTAGTSLRLGFHRHIRSSRAGALPQTGKSIKQSQITRTYQQCKEETNVFIDIKKLKCI